VGGNVFQIDELVYSYRVISSIDLEKNSKFHVVENIIIDVDIEKLNDVQRTIGHTKIDEDDGIDEHQLNEEYYDGHKDDEIDEEEDNFANTGGTFIASILLL
jgi:hypothetical protein